jgi:hypothetical protein
MPIAQTGHESKRVPATLRLRVYGLQKLAGAILVHNGNIKASDDGDIPLQHGGVLVPAGQTDMSQC